MTPPPARPVALLHRAIAALVPTIVRRSMRRDLAGVWWAGPALPQEGVVVVANHHSWWDGYLVWSIAHRARRPFAVLVDAATLERYPFFGRLGAVPASAVREAARRARAGACVVVFPEGALSPAGRLAPFARGASVVSALADVPVMPMAWRVVVRGGQYPEVYVRSAPSLPPGAPADDQHRAVGALLGRIDHDLNGAVDAEAPLPGYVPWLAGRRSTSDRASRWRAWWGA